MNYFIYKNNREEERDCVKYIDTRDLGILQCGHYYSQVKFCGACFCGDLDDILEDNNVLEDLYNDLTTILTIEDFKRLKEYNKKIKELGYGLDKQPNKIELGKQYYNEIVDIIHKLESEENAKIFEQVQEEEKEYLKEEYNLTDNDIEKIFESYNEDYRDRAVVGCVYNDVKDLGECEFENLYNIEENLKQYIDYAKFGEDLLEEEYYVQLDDERVVGLSY